MAATMTVTEARAQLPHVVDLVIAGHEVTITRHGEPVAVVVNPRTLRPRRAEAALAEAARLHEVLEEARSLPLSEAVLSEEAVEELIADIRRARHAR